MAEATNGFAPDAADPRGASGVGAKASLAVQLMGAAMSLALLAGGGIWGYKLIVRDATGVPVVRAMSGPMREAPSDPGGVVALHTGLSVNTVAAEGEAAPPEDVLVLAPPTPDLTDEDLMVMPTAEADEFHPEVPVPVAASPVETAEAAPLSVAPSDQPMSAEDILALADSISAGATPLSELSEAPIVATSPDAELAEAAPIDSTDVVVPDTTSEMAVSSDAIDGDAPSEDAAALAIAQAVAEAAGASELETDGPVELAAVDGDGRLLRSLRPSNRPEGLTAAAAEAPAEAEPAAVQGFAVSTAEVPLGTTLVQLGAFDSPELAGAEWQRLSARFEAFMTGKENLIQEATSGGRAFFRLRATGFVDIADARRFCSALVSEGAACIPVVIQ
ncbi:SPOR domain-containing protein [Flavimaricola marinus]|uniref:Sporulation related domain protein n=1 Tax=Flavimaricola marinus TaxID=1819565 RepID=A0A238LJ51_9RHOB|nr:SPOR domain-containing protein [Flavimaricola marinus]SMY09648.1 Sporulation related domain protein [Flavimaricola marinus]